MPLIRPNTDSELIGIRLVGSSSVKSQGGCQSTLDSYQVFCSMRVHVKVLCIDIVIRLSCGPTLAQVHKSDVSVAALQREKSATRNYKRLDLSHSSRARFGEFNRSN